MLNKLNWSRERIARYLKELHVDYLAKGFVSLHQTNSGGGKLLCFNAMQNIFHLFVFEK